jgi:hypothetical protein
MYLPSYHHLVVFRELCVQKLVPPFNVQWGWHRWDAAFVSQARLLLHPQQNYTNVHIVETYTAQATAGDVNKGLSNHKVRVALYHIRSIVLICSNNLESSDTALLVFGNGDGGGGPLAKMLENVGDTLNILFRVV